MRNRRQRLFSLVTNWLGAISLLGMLGYLLPGLEGLRLLLLLFPLALLARALQARAASDAAAPSLPNPPLNQSAGSPARFAVRFALSQALILLNPLQVAQIIPDRRTGHHQQPARSARRTLRPTNALHPSLSRRVAGL